MICRGVYLDEAPDIIQDVVLRTVILLPWSLSRISQIHEHVKPVKQLPFFSKRKEVELELYFN